MHLTDGVSIDLQHLPGEPARNNALVFMSAAALACVRGRASQHIYLCLLG